MSPIFSGTRSQPSATPRSGSMRPYAAFIFDAAAGRLTAVKARSISGKRLTVAADWFVARGRDFRDNEAFAPARRTDGGSRVFRMRRAGPILHRPSQGRGGAHRAARQQANQLAFGYHIGGSTRRGPPPGNDRKRSARRPGRERLRDDTRRVSAALDPSLSCAIWENRFRRGGSPSFCQSPRW